MARQSVWTNVDGLQVGFGARTSIVPFAGTVLSLGGNEEMLSLVLDYRDMPTTDNVNFYNATATDPVTKSVPIPANSLITEAKLVVHSSFTCAAGNPTMTIGLMTSGGTVIDGAGLYAGLTEASSQLLANAVVDGDVATYGGALVNGLLTIGANAGHIYCAGVTMLTAATKWDTGLATLTVKYLRQVPDYDPTNPHSTTTKLA